MRTHEYCAAVLVTGSRLINLRHQHILDPCNYSCKALERNPMTIDMALLIVKFYD